MFYQNFFKKFIKFFTIISLSQLLVVSSFAAGGGGDDNKKMDVKSNYYYKAVKLINKKSYKAAIDNLLKAEKTNKKDADIYNYLGFSYRKINQLDKASTYYKKALEINPKHKGALEYQGEMFITLNQIKDAENNLKILDKICFLGCAEFDKLKKSIENAKIGKKSSY